MKLKIRIMETRQFRQNSHILQKSFYARMRRYFRQFKQGIYRKTAMNYYYNFFIIPAALLHVSIPEAALRTVFFPPFIKNNG